MPGEGPFLWLGKDGPPSGFWQLPANGMCVSVFLFVTKGDRLLLGKYADDPAWTRLTGLDPGRYQTHGRGWTLPASHLKFGEAPVDGARRVMEQVLGIPHAAVVEAGMESDQYTPKRFPHLGEHYDLWLFYEARLPSDTLVERPAWYRELAFHDPVTLRDEDYARGHEDVVARWISRRATSVTRRDEA
ncbi:MAG TPA: hypothetical protein VM370_11050 [Candidatus Thermoplasmatota archaeon]|nr:hypothetical protein [Candidatus Thermoplasmatota archaeon]